MAELVKTAIISEEIVYLKHSSTLIDLNAPLDPPKNAVQAETMDDLKLIKENSFNQGFSEGIAQASAQMTEQINTLNTLLQNIPAAISDNRLQLSAEIADIVLSITQQFFINQQQNKESIAEQITQTIVQLNNKQNIELSLHPYDFALLQQGEINVDLKQCKNLRVIADEGLRLGGCVVRSEHGVFDASIERQIDRLKHVLLAMKRVGNETSWQ